MGFAVSYVSLIIHADSLARYYKLKTDLENTNYDLYWIIQDGIEIREKIKEYPDINFVILSNNDKLQEKYHKLKYCWEVKYHYDPNKIDNFDVPEDIKYKFYINTGKHFNTVLLYIEFQNLMPNYDKYWFIEYDMIFNGDWKYFFNTIDTSNCDFICEHLSSLEDNIQVTKPYAKYVKYNANDYNVKKCMLCICRFSNKLLKDLYNYYQDNFGFMESLVPTFALANNYTVIDINDINNFYIPTKNNMGSISWSEEDLKQYINIKNILCHPVK